MHQPPISETKMREVIREYVAQLRQGMWGLNILMSELVDKKNWAAPLPIPKKKIFSLAEMKNAYEKRVEALVQENRSSSREEDDVWAKAKGFPITVVRKFRNELSPLSWRTKGRRPGENKPASF